MGLSFDLYGRKSLENRFVFYLAALVLMMMTFCGFIVTSESHRYFAEELALHARYTAKAIAALSPAQIARSSVLDPQVIAVIEWIPGRGPELLMGQPLTAYTLPPIEPIDPFELEVGRRPCWAFVEQRGPRKLIVILDASMAWAHWRMLAGTMMWITALALVVHAFLAKVMARKVMRPVRQFIEAMGKITQGKVASPLTVAEEDEMGRLKYTFNYMQKQLQEKEATERTLANHEHLSTVGKLAAGIAHEIRNPLASVSSLTQMIASDPAAPPKNQEYARVILREIRRIDGSIQELLNFAKPLKPDFTNTLLSKPILQVIQLMELDAKNRGATLKFDKHWIAEEPLLVDAKKVEQMIINLVKNGIEALGQQGTITLGLAWDEGTERAIITVEDDGPGMSAALKDGAFDTWVTTKGGGSGLGLAIVQRLVAMHNGQITVDTEVNRGTRFTISLPRMTPETVAKI